MIYFDEKLVFPASKRDFPFTTQAIKKGKWRNEQNAKSHEKEKKEKEIEKHPLTVKIAYTL